MQYQKFVFTRAQLNKTLLALQCAEITMRHAGFARPDNDSIPQKDSYKRIVNEIAALKKTLAAEPEYEVPEQYAKFVA